MLTSITNFPVGSLDDSFEINFTEGEGEQFRIIKFLQTLKSLEGFNA